MTVLTPVVIIGREPCPQQHPCLSLVSPTTWPGSSYRSGRAHSAVERRAGQRGPVSNRGARSAGVDRRTASSIALHVGVEDVLDALQSTRKHAPQFRPLPLRERMIPKPDGKQRRMGIATITDRAVQASLKLVLEPIFEADS
jgi:retron-type reverse transcriptase